MHALMVGHVVDGLQVRLRLECHPQHRTFWSYPGLIELVVRELVGWTADGSRRALPAARHRVRAQASFSDGPDRIIRARTGAEAWAKVRRRRWGALPNLRSLCIFALSLDGDAMSLGLRGASSPGPRRWTRGRLTRWPRALRPVWSS